MDGLSPPDWLDDGSIDKGIDSSGESSPLIFTKSLVVGVAAVESQFLLYDLLFAMRRKRKVFFNPF